jgi:anti-sigma-K factor RskA
MSGDPSLGAAEYVLGTLDEAERAAFAERLAHDAAAQEAVRAWERRLAPLASVAPAAQPDPDLWRRIETRLGADVIDLVRSRARWRMATAAFGALAACLAVVAVVGPDAERPAPPLAAPQIAQAEGPPRPPAPAGPSGAVQTAAAPREQGSGVSLAIGGRDGGGLAAGGGASAPIYVATLARPATPELAFRYDPRAGTATITRLAGAPAALRVWLVRPGSAPLLLAVLPRGEGAFVLPADVSVEGAEIGVAPAADAGVAQDVAPGAPFLLEGRILPQ